MALVVLAHAQLSGLVASLGIYLAKGNLLMLQKKFGTAIAHYSEMLTITNDTTITLPSLLTVDIMSQLPQVVVNVPEDSQKFCIVSNPTIPQFMLQDETWNLGIACSIMYLTVT